MAKKCRACKQRFEPYNSLQVACSAKCALDYARQKQQEQWDRETRRRKREMNENDRTYQLKKLQEEFNAYIRARDEGEACISCNRKTGCKMNAGHYRSVGACPELRFEPLNVWLQCEHCNSFKSGNAIDYRINLIERIGLEKVQWLEGPHPPKKYTLEEIKAMRKEYREKTRELKRKTEAA